MATVPRLHKETSLFDKSIAHDLGEVSDVANAASPKSDAIKRTQRIWYRKNSSGAPSTPGTQSSNWVTKDDDGSNAWTKMHIAITSTDKYIYTCEQYEMANGTVGYTSVLLDNTITVIDGGNIITGSVSANAVNASSGTFDVANIPILNASKINVDSITQIGPSNGNHVVVDSGSFDFVNDTTDVATLELLNSDPDDVQVNLRLDGGFGNNFLSAYTGQVVHDTSSDTTRLTSSLAAHYYGTPSASDGQLNLSSMSVRSGAYLSDVYMQARDITVVPIKQPPLTIYNAPLDNFGHLIRSRVDIAWTTINVGANTGSSVMLTWLGGGFDNSDYIAIPGRMNGPNGYTKIQFAITARTETTVTVSYWNDYGSAINGMVLGVIGVESRYGTAI